MAVAGNIGAGKTELVGFLARRYGARPFEEPNERNPYLVDFYRDMKGYAFRSQLWFLLEKYELHRQLLGTRGLVLLDRTIYEDAEVFARNAFEAGLVEPRDWEMYQHLYRTLQRELRPPDLLIFLKARVPTLRKRIAKRGRESERDLPKAYLERLDRLYASWIAGYDLSPVLTLETDDVDWLTDLVDRLDVLTEIERHLR